MRRFYGQSEGLSLKRTTLTGYLQLLPHELINFAIVNDTK